MATTWSTLSASLDTLLDDADQASYSDTLRIEAFNRACQYFAITHTALFKNIAATAAPYAQGVLVAYPESLLELPSGGIQDITGRNSYWLEPTPLMPGEDTPTRGYTEIEDGILVYDTDTTDVRIWYFAGYRPIVDGTTVTNLPLWCEWAVLNLAVAYLMYPGMLSQQNLRQFQTRREAGEPEDNPPRRQAMFHMQVYRDIVSTVRQQERSLLFRTN